MLSSFDVEAEQIGLQRRYFCATDNNFLLSCIESKNILHQPVALCQRSYFQVFQIGSAFQFAIFPCTFSFCLRIHQIQVVETVALTLVNKFTFVPRQEYQRMLRFYVFRVLFFIQYSFSFTCGSLIAYKLGMILVTVQFDDINMLLIGRPANVGKITVGRVTGLQVNYFSSLYIVYSYRHFVAGHSCHRIFVRLKSRDTGRCIYQRIVCDHALVHAIESQIASFRAPECTFINTEFVTVYSLSVNYPFFCL